MTYNEVLNNLTILGNVIKLPNIVLEPKVYKELSNSFKKIGGKWKGGKISGFVFEEDPTPYIEDLKNGLSRNINKEFQFFPTPKAVAEEMSDWYNKKYKTILEPSAGDGALIKALYERHPSLNNERIDVCELMPLNKVKLSNLNDNIVIMEDDFMNLSLDKKYDFIIANPPFTKNQDIDHVLKMYEHLNHSGRLVVITSTHWNNSNNKKEKNFKDFIEKNSIFTEELEENTFKESNTSIKTMFIVIEK